MQAAALKGTVKVIETLMGYAKSFEPGTPEFNAYMGAIRTLNAVAKKSTAGPGASPSAPLPVPATPPGAGLGGLGAPPTGAPAPGGIAGPGSSMAPGIES
jgi:hypothetical protein